MDTRYEQLLKKLERIGHIQSVSSLLQWDEQVMLPALSHEARAKQLSVLAEFEHAASTEASLKDLIDELEADTSGLDTDALLVLEEAKKDYERHSRLSDTFVSTKATLQSQSYHAWVKAREQSDYSIFAPYLAKIIQLAKDEADMQGFTQNPYDYFIDKHDPGLNNAFVKQQFEALLEELVPLSQSIIAAAEKTDVSFLKNFDIQSQGQFIQQVLETLGFDFKHGRLDTAVHPFCSGCGMDTRLTTRYDKDEPLDSLFSAIHEAGHGLYEQGIPSTPYGTALTRSIGMAVHESQSRLWENQVGRSRAFWQYLEPLYRSHFPNELREVSSDALYLAINAVKPMLIRVDADEVSYNLHIVLRHRIETMLFDGELAVDELPAAWNELSKDLLALEPSNDAQGVLQDVHWSCGEFGYFPSYCLGNMIAAQMWHTAQDHLPKLSGELASGNTRSLLEWLRSNIHAHGKRFSTLELVQNLTGKALSPAPLIQYLKERYGKLYENP